MKLTVANANITNALSTARITLSNASISNFVSIGSVSIAPSQISVGNTSITPTVVSVPALVLGGSQFAGGLQGGIINYQEFTANGTWYNPYANASVNSSLTGYEQVLVMAWGGGGGGASNNSVSSGGGGGSFNLGYYKVSDLSNTISVVIGNGGTASRTTTTSLVSAGNGGNSSFGSFTVYGGTGAGSDGGGGGGVLSQTTAGGAGGAPLGGAAGNPGGTSTFGGGGGSNAGGANGGVSIFGGGGGSRGNAITGGNSIYGGGGGGTTVTAVGGTSVFGGAGANSTGTAFAPGGGGGSSVSAASAGARGEVRVWVFGPAGTTVGPPTYTLIGNTNTLYEGSSILYTVATTNIPNGTTLYYNINSSSQVTSSDLTSYTGSFIINGGVGSFLITANTSYTNNINRSLIIDVKNNSTSGPVVLSNTVTLLGAVNKFSTANQSTTFVVPSGISSILIKAWGAGGCADGSTSGGGGGYSTATISVTAGESLTVYVPTSGVTTSGYGGPGGSFAGVFRSTTPLIIAGGGGGGGKDGGSVNGADGGGGGGTTGEDGYSAPTGGGGGGGTQSAGGAGGSSQGGAPGEAGETDGRYYGGDGGSIAGLSGIPGYNGLAEGGIGGVIQNGGGGGGGGGAGYYGGGGGGRGDGGGNRGGGGGGGGSGYVSGTNTLLQRATGRPCANTTDIDYNGSAGVGGSPGDNSGSNGYVVIRGVS